jgi:hypothetical protein
MDEFTVFDERAEVIGQMMLAFQQCGDQELIQRLLEKHGLSNIQAHQWYPLQRWLNVLRELVEDGQGFNLVDIGAQLIDSAMLPPGFNQLSIVEALNMLNEARKINNRNGDSGEYTIEMVDEQHVKITARISYPDDWLFGMFYGGMRRFLPAGHPFVVYYDEQHPRRGLGGDKTIFHITWD